MPDPLAQLREQPDVRSDWLVIGTVVVMAAAAAYQRTTKAELAEASPPVPAALTPAIEVPAPPPVVAVQGNHFAGYACTSDCSGHEAGYQWAEENDISDADDCDGNSESFIEGCKAYANEQSESQAEQPEDGENEETEDGE